MTTCTADVTPPEGERETWLHPDARELDCGEGHRNWRQCPNCGYLWRVAPTPENRVSSEVQASRTDEREKSHTPIA